MGERALVFFVYNLLSLIYFIYLQCYCSAATDESGGLAMVDTQPAN